MRLTTPNQQGSRRVSKEISGVDIKDLTAGVNDLRKSVDRRSTIFIVVGVVGLVVVLALASVAFVALSAANTAQDSSDKQAQETLDRQEQACFTSQHNAGDYNQAQLDTAANRNQAIADGLDQAFRSIIPDPTEKQEGQLQQLHDSFLFNLNAATHPALQRVRDCSSPEAIKELRYYPDGTIEAP